MTPADLAYEYRGSTVAVTGTEYGITITHSLENGRTHRREISNQDWANNREPAVAQACAELAVLAGRQ